MSVGLSLFNPVMISRGCKLQTMTKKQHKDIRSEKETVKKFLTPLFGGGRELKEVIDKIYRPKRQR